MGSTLFDGPVRLGAREACWRGVAESAPRSPRQHIPTFSAPHFDTSDPHLVVPARAARTAAPNLPCERQAFARLQIDPRSTPARRQDRPWRAAGAVAATLRRVSSEPSPPNSSKEDAPSTASPSPLHAGLCQVWANKNTKTMTQKYIRSRGGPKERRRANLVDCHPSGGSEFKKMGQATRSGQST